MSIICCRMPGHRKGWLTNKPLAESASSFAAEWHFLVTLCLNEARQVRPHASVSDRRSGRRELKRHTEDLPQILGLGTRHAASQTVKRGVTDSGERATV